MTFYFCQTCIAVGWETVALPTQSQVGELTLYSTLIYLS
jgi:hypothetical protein